MGIPLSNWNPKEYTALSTITISLRDLFLMILKSLI
jgi:hypothetical protein